MHRQGLKRGLLSTQTMRNGKCRVTEQRRICIGSISHTYKNDFLFFPDFIPAASKRRQNRSLSTFSHASTYATKEIQTDYFFFYFTSSLCLPDPSAGDFFGSVVGWSSCMLLLPLCEKVEFFLHRKTANLKPYRYIRMRYF